MTAYTLHSTDGLARRGTFRTAHGTFDTPNFMPVGTRGSVRGVDTDRLLECGAQIMLVNTYHLWLRPGPETIAELGGIHRFVGWDGTILSDSGGFQVYSLSSHRKLTEAGVEFQSHIDGSKQFLSPELAVSIQEQFGVDIAMVLDECPEGGVDERTAEESLNLTLRWAKRCLEARKRPDMQLFGITQGNVHARLRQRAAEELAALPFDGLAIGGLSVGEEKPKMYDVLSYHPQQLPVDRIRYLMGVGTPADIVEAVKHGVDIFDCVMPTRAGRSGRAFVRTREEPFINVTNARFQRDKSPIDADCDCLACRKYSLGFIRHLFNMNEMLGPQLVSIHNLKHYLDLMQAVRSSIEARSFAALHRTVRERWKSHDVESDPKDS